MPSTPAATALLSGVDHLADVAGFRAGPLVAAAEQFARVLDPVLGRDEERVRRHVVDEREFVFLARAEDARGAAAASDALDPHALRMRAHRAGGDAGQRGAAQKRAPVESWSLDVLTFGR